MMEKRDSDMREKNESNFTKWRQ